jgi:Fe2+ or Zn2+ uptake regulation protein
MERITNQKKIISDYLKSVNTHPNIQEIYLVVRKKLPRISLGTVYRIVNNLREKGEIQEIAGGTSRFDGNTLPHCHFFCERCKKIFDVFEKNEIFIKKKLTPSKFALRLCNRAKVDKITNYQIYFYGFCHHCQKKQNLLP